MIKWILVEWYRMKFFEARDKLKKGELELYKYQRIVKRIEKKMDKLGRSIL